MMIANFIRIFKEIDPSKKYSSFTYFDANSFEQAAFGCDNKEIYKIDGAFFQVQLKEVVSSVKLNNVVVKSGRKTIKEFSI